MPRSSQELSSVASLPAGTSGVLSVDRVQPAHRLRMAQLGLRASARVTVLGRTAGGGRLVATGTTRIGVDAATSRLLALVPEGEVR